MNFKQKTFTAAALYLRIQDGLRVQIAAFACNADGGSASLVAVRALVQCARDLLGRDAGDALAAEGAREVYAVVALRESLAATEWRPWAVPQEHREAV